MADPLAERAGRPRRIARETRLLLLTALIAIAVLWLLARVRFPDRAVTPNPVPPLLTQIAPLPRFADLAAEVSAARARLEASLFSVRVGDYREAVAIRPGVAVTWLGSAATHLSIDDAEVVARDAASGVGLVRMRRTDVTFPPLWMPGDLGQARYLIASDVAGDRITARPVFIGALVPLDGTGWPGRIWLLPAHTDIHAGSFAFTPNGELVGLVIPYGNTRALVPGDVLVRGTAYVETADSAP